MVQNPSWVANWFAASQEIPRISRNPKVHYRTHKRPPLPHVFLNMNVLQGGVVSTSPNPQAGGPPLVDCPRLLIQFIHSYPPYQRPFVYPQPEDAPCHGNRDPLHGIFIKYGSKFVCCYVVVFLCTQTSNSSLIPYGPCPCTLCSQFLLRVTVTVTLNTCQTGARSKRDQT